VPPGTKTHRAGLADRLPRVALTACIAWLCLHQPAQAQNMVDILEYFRKAKNAAGAGLARKTKLVDARPARPGEIIVTTIAGQGKETQSPPAKAGDMVVRNRCAETGNEQFLVSTAQFARRYEGPVGPSGTDGWRPYRPRGVTMRYVVVPEADGALSFLAPWGETMTARPGDAIVQDPKNPKDTYRVAKAAFTCTYEIIRRQR
jgi:hypothetical protein